MISEDILKSLPRNLHGALENPSMLSQILDAIPFQIIIKSLREENFGEFLVWNRAAEETLGIAASEAIGRKDREFFPPDQVEFFAAQDRAVARGGKPILTPSEQIVSRKHGVRTLRTVKTPILDQEDKPVALMAVSEDITDELTTEIELQRALDFLSHVNSQLPGAVYQFKVDDLGRAAFPYVSEGICLVTGDEAEEVTSGRVNLLSRVLPEDLPGFLAGVAKSRREMSTCRQEFRVQTHAGEIRWLLSNSAPKRQPDGSTLWYGFVTDITSHKETTEALQRRGELLHSALSATRAAAWELDVASGHIYLSPEWGNLFGFSPEEYPTNSSAFFRMVHEEDQPGIGPILRWMEKGDDPAWKGQIEFRHRRKGGGYLWVLVSGKSVLDTEGNLLRLVGTVMDITERKKIEAQLIEAKENAEHASQAKGNFLAMMSHEIRTPLNAVLGFSDILSSTPLNAEQADYLRTIQDNSAALLVILNDVLDYSKIESGRLDLHRTPVNVARLVGSAVDFFRPQADARGLALEFALSPDFPEMFLCDSTRVGQVLHNLLSNAIKFTEQGGVRVDLGLAHSSNNSTHPVVIRVRDTGVGIALDRHPSLFEPFYQADNTTARKFGGTGLGLAIVKKLVDLMGGEIRVESRLGEGADFIVTLPMVVPELIAATAVSDYETSSMFLGQRSPAILLIEDNATNRRLVRLFLQRFGCEADEAANGFEGVEMAKRRPYDMIFMDLEMPGMDGYEATRLIRKIPRDSGPMIVALTAHAMPEHRERSLQAGMNAYLSKPVKKEDIAGVLRQFNLL